MLNQLSSVSKDGRDSATLILIKNSPFDRTALYLLVGAVQNQAEKADLVTVPAGNVSIRQPQRFS